MAERIIVQRRGDFLAPVYPDGAEAIRALPTGKDLAADIKQPRNVKLHRKAFALANLAFSYWEPDSFVSATETNTVEKLGQFLVRQGMDSDTVQALSSEFLRDLNNRREMMDMEKSFEAFRSFVTIEAGYYTVAITPSGPRKEARSWAFANMAEEEFQAFYAALMNACWKLVLGQTFESPEEAERAAEQLLHFD